MGYSTRPQHPSSPQAIAKPSPQAITMTIDKSSQKVRTMFSDIAGTYDLLNHVLSGNQDVRWRRRAVLLLGPRREELILDLCCGTGDLGREILRQQPRCEVIGADFAIPMLEIAQAKFEGNQEKAHAAFAAADALRLPFESEIFNGVSVGYGVRNWTDTRAGLGEVHRVLKPGGRLLVLEFMRAVSPAMRSFYGAFNGFLAPLGRRISGHASAYDYLPQSIADFYTRHEFSELLRETGFENVRSFNYFGGVSTAFIAHKKR
jgi:demethylmenaquinone methyltransferase/2-methoxy-6-polyprenyl-1,4-benzoquinol methylase